VKINARMIIVAVHDFILTDPVIASAQRIGQRKSIFFVISGSENFIVISFMVLNPISPQVRLSHIHASIAQATYDEESPQVIPIRLILTSLDVNVSILVLTS
jgi:hypothetical protein